MEIRAIKGDRVRLKNADTIALNAGVRKMTWPDAYSLVIAPSTDRFWPFCAVHSQETSRSNPMKWVVRTNAND